MEEGKTIGWIGRKIRQARAIVSVTLLPGRGATDWAAGERFNSDKVWEPENRGDLHRHHVFPRALLKENGFSLDQINHGLNGILLSASANKSFSRADPREYLESILSEDYCPSKQKLRSWVESHLVPCDVIVSKDSVEKRYRQFIKRRARLVANEFRVLTQPPVQSEALGQSQADGHSGIKPDSGGGGGSGYPIAFLRNPSIGRAAKNLLSPLVQALSSQFG